MSRIFRIFLILIVAYAVAGCSPFGSIGVSDTVDLFWAVPNRLTYNSGERFIPNSELQVFASNQGVVKSISLSLVEIGIAENPYIPNDLEKIQFDKAYVLHNTGRKLIVLKYAGTSAIYSILVSPSENGNTGIQINWNE
jgi:hypothetical protein